MPSAFKPHARGSSEHYACSIAWLRRDLRIGDNVALYDAARRSDSVCVAFVLDAELLHGERMGAPLVQSFFYALGALREELRERASDLALLEGDVTQELLQFSGERVEWRSSAGMTGYPIVDAAMRQLNTHGWMRNRCCKARNSIRAAHSSAR
ncbi:MAG: deoxyribodipyrimidine photo-lyase [Vulcanimicrobiaceae bacterium]